MSFKDYARQSDLIGCIDALTEEIEGHCKHIKELQITNGRLRDELGRFSPMGRVHEDALDKLAEAMNIKEGLQYAMEEADEDVLYWKKHVERLSLHLPKTPF
jgi:hypothetical protein